LFTPAMLLILVSFAGVLVNGYQTLMVFTEPERAERAIGWLLDEGAKAMQQEGSKEAKDASIRLAPIVFPIVLGGNVVSLLAGIAIMFRRLRWLGILGSLLAMINIGNCCCLIGLPA